LAFLNKGKNGSTILINRDAIDVSKIYPEVQLHSSVRYNNVVLDGELVVMTNGVPDFYATRSRSLSKNEFKIQIASRQTPVSFVAFDILRKNGKDLCNLKLTERKKILEDCVIESEYFSVSRPVETDGLKLFEAAVANNLEGVIAKRMDSLYYPGKRTNDWLKFVNPNFPATRNLIK